MGKYSKAIIAVIGAVVTVLVQQYSSNEVVASLIPFLTAIGVYSKANK